MPNTCFNCFFPFFCCRLCYGTGSLGNERVMIT